MKKTTTTSLAEQLKAQQKKSESQREQRQIDVMHGSTTDLIKKGIEKTALQTGDTIPAYKDSNRLQNSHGTLIDIFDILKSHPIVLTFYRGSWCPYCNLTLRAYQEQLAGIQNSGAQLMAISPELSTSSLANAKKFGLQFEILADVGNLLAKQFGLAYKMPAELIAVYLELGTNIPHFNGDDSWELPVPATYIIDSRGKIIFSTINAEYLERIEPKLIISALKDR